MDNYEVNHRLGRGGCAAVYLVRHKESRKLFAMKKIELDDRKKTRTKVAVEKEARILSQLRHPHIVLYHESFFDGSEEFLNIIQDYCDGGSLDDKIKGAAGKASYFEEMQIMEWFIQIIMAVQYIHSKKVLHRDLKAENVFLTRKNVVKIGDFGISKVLENTVDVAQTIVGTPSYLSPELCQDIPYSSKSDIWAVGCLLYEMCALRPPFDAQNLISLFFKIIKGEFEPIPSKYSPEFHELVKAVLVKTPDDRPSASAILNIPIVKTHHAIFIGPVIASAILNTPIVKTHLAIFIEMKETLLQQKASKDDSNVSSNNNTPATSAKTTPKRETLLQQKASKDDSNVTSNNNTPTTSAKTTPKRETLLQQKASKDDSNVTSNNNTPTTSAKTTPKRETLLQQKASKDDSNVTSNNNTPATSAKTSPKRETLLQQKASKDDSNVTSNNNTPATSAKTTPKSDKPMECSSPAIKRNKVRLAGMTLVQRSQILAGGDGRAAGQQDSGLDNSSETDLSKDKRLEVPKLDQDASSDYSDDFDESSASEAEPEEEDDDIKEEIEAGGAESGESDIEDVAEVERGEDGAEDVEYADDFEEYDSSEDLGQMVCQAREAQDIEAVDDWFADSMSDIHLQQHKILQQQCKQALGGRGLQEVGRLVNDGTLTEDDLRPNLRLKSSSGEDDAEICHFDLGDLDSG